MNRAAWLVFVIVGMVSTKDALSEEVILLSGWRINYATSLTESANRGAITELYDPNGEPIFLASDNLALFDWNIGIQRPATAQIETFGDYAVATMSDFRSLRGELLPLRALIIFDGTDRELYCKAILTASSECRLENGVGILIPVGDSPRVDFYNTRGRLDNNAIPSDLTQPFRLPYQNRFITQSSLGALQINLRNPLLPVPARTSNGVELELVSWFPPNVSISTGSKNLSSILLPGDTLTFEWGVTSAAFNDPPSSYACFSPHPRGGDCSTYLAFDDIPGLEPNWAIPTDSRNTSTPVSSRFLEILDEFPDVKFTWLLLTDSIQRLGNWRFIGWWPPTANVYPDSSIFSEGRISCRLELPSGNVGSSVISQIIALSPGVTHRLEFMMRGEYSNSLPDFNLIIMSWSPAYKISSSVFPVPNGEWVKHSVDFVSDSIGTVSLTFRAGGTNSNVYIDDVTCTNLQTGLNVVASSGFESYMPFIYYDPPDSTWPNARSMGRLSVEATPEYLHWLKVIQDSSPEWPYSDQVGTALHGLHHTPDTTFITNTNHTHEFNFVDPVGDSIRMERISEEIKACNLDTSKILSFFRFPGHRHTESLLNPMFTHGVRVIDQGSFDDRFYSGSLQRLHRKMWVTNSVYWNDKYLERQSRNLERALNGGMFALMGCHFHIMNSPDTPGEQERAHAFFRWIEDNYPRLEWLKGSELADLWDEIGSIHNIRQSGYSGNISLSWVGSSKQDETLFINVPDRVDEPLICTVDGLKVEAQGNGTRVFVTLPDLDYGEHRMVLAVLKNFPVEQDHNIWRVIGEDAETFTVSRIYSQDSNVRVSIYDIAGRRVSQSEPHILAAGLQRLSIPTPKGPTGIYFARIEETGQEMIVTLPRIR